MSWAPVAISALFMLSGAVMWRWAIRNERAAEHHFRKSARMCREAAAHEHQAANDLRWAQDLVRYARGR